VHDIPELDDKGLRRFALVTGGLLIALFGAVLPWLFEFPYPLWPWGLGGALGLWGVVAPASLNPVYRAWMKFGLILNRITTPIVLGIVFFLVILPIALVLRLSGRDPMARTFDDASETYRITRSAAAKSSVERPF
jgi:hypothetical protein